MTETAAASQAVRHAARRALDAATNCPLAAHLQAGDMTVTQLATATGLTNRQVRYALQQLREAGLVTLIGSPGRRLSRYERRA